MRYIFQAATAKELLPDFEQSEIPGCFFKQVLANMDLKKSKSPQPGLCSSALATCLLFPKSCSFFASLNHKHHPFSGQLM